MENTEEGREEMKRKEKDTGQDIEEEEIITAMKRMKMKKAHRGDTDGGVMSRRHYG